MVSISPSDKGPGRAVAAKDKFSVVKGRGNPVGVAPERKGVFARAGKRTWAAVKRVNKVVGEAEARLILRVFYYTVFGIVSLALRKGRRKTIENEEHAVVAWSPRVSPGTDPTKQY